MKILDTLNQLSAHAATGSVFRNTDDTLPSFGNDGQNDVGTVVAEGLATFRVVQTFFTVIGVGIVIFTFWKVIKSLVTGKIPDAVKSGFGGLVAAIFCFNLDLPLGLVDSMGGVFRTAFKAIRDLL